MPIRRVLVLLALFFVSLANSQNSDGGKNKNDHKKKNLPADVLAARTVLVLIDPDTGVSLTDPGGNRTARQDVETAIMRWGRFTPVMDGMNADLVIAVRKGNGKMVNPSVGGVPVNDRPSVLEGDQSTIRIGGQRGRPMSTDIPQDRGPTPRAEIGETQDVFVVYRGSVDSAPVWRYMAKGALHSPGVPAVAEFRKAIEEADKQQKSKP